MSIDDIFKVVNERYSISHAWVREFRTKALRKMSHRCIQRYILIRFPEYVRSPEQARCKSALEDNYPVVSSLFREICVSGKCYTTLDNTRIERLKLSPRANERFYERGIVTVGQILRKDELDLRRILRLDDLVKEVIGKLHQMDVSLLSSTLSVAG